MRKITCKKRSVNQPSRLFLFLCTAPTLILTVYFILVPTLKAFVLSFTDSTMLGINVHFVGLDNYAYMFHDKNFLQYSHPDIRLSPERRSVDARETILLHTPSPCTNYL